MSEQECLSAIHAYREQATMTDFPNRIAALFFTSECNFRCPYCHNPQLLHKAKNLSFRDLERICTSMKKQWIGGVVITGGEPTLQKSLPHTIAFLKKRGYEVKLDTNASNSSMLEEILPMLDYVAIDLKTAPEDYDSFTTCKGCTGEVEKSIDLIMKSNVDYEFRTTIVEAIHNDETIRACARFIANARKYVLQPFVPHDNLPNEKYRLYPRTKHAFLEHAANIARQFVPNTVIRGK